jgi:hypothetical protein
MYVCPYMELYKPKLNLIQDEVVPVLNNLRTVPGRYMGEWRYSSTFLVLGTRWR